MVDHGTPLVEHHLWRARGLCGHVLEVPGDGWGARSLSQRSFQHNVMPGFACPARGPWDRGSPPARPGTAGSQPSGLCSAQTATSLSRGRSVLPFLPRYLVALVLLCVPCSCKARLRGASRLPAPGVFASPVGTPPPDFLQGHLWLSHVPASPLCMHAPLSDPGGLLHTRLVAARTAAFRPLHAVGFPSLSLEAYPVDHHETECGAPSRGLPPRSLQLRTSLAGGARGLHS